MPTHHAIDYIEIQANDIEASKRFYSDAFGWNFTEYGPEYAGIQKHGGGEAGGLRQVDEVPSGGGCLIILYSSDLGASLQGVRDAGGRIVQEPFDFPGGSRFHFEDPAGNELAVWSDSAPN